MRERQILFRAPMVRAILEGRKSQTRRIVKPQPLDAAPELAQHLARRGHFEWFTGGDEQGRWRCPYGQPGDRLWVRETWRETEDGYDYKAGKGPMAQAFTEVFDFILARKWRPSIHMPRAASRILLEIVAVRVERLHDISEEDALAEGVYADAACNGMFTADGNTYTTKQDGAAGAYAELWESINGPSSWAANPWVWVVEFKKVSPGETAGVAP